MRFSKLLLVLTTIGGLLVSSDSSVVAATATANLPVSATVSANCTITTTAVGFPAYDPIGTHASTPDDSTAGDVRIVCTKGSGTSINLGLGANVSGTQPRMKSGASDYLNYMLYSDSGRATAWSGASLAVTAAPSRAERVYPVYGRIPSGQDVPAGTYTDTVLATVNF